MIQKSFHIRTYGCQMNERDSQVLAQTLEAAGYREAEDEAQADIVLVNSCSVRGKAEDKAIGKIGLLCAGMRERPDLVVGLMGCMAQRLGNTIFKRIPKLSFTVGTRAASIIPSILQRVYSGEKKICEIGVIDDPLAGGQTVNGQRSTAIRPGGFQDR